MTATAAEPFVVDKPGVYDIASDVYHSDPTPHGSLSCSGAKLLLPPSCPALFKYRQENPAEPKKTFDLGHAAHDAVLGGGPEIVRVDEKDWRTNRAKAAAKEARGRGAVPLLADDWQTVQDMAAALRRHPVASRLLSPDYGTAEASLFWRDDAAGIDCRARLDVLPHGSGGRMIIPDYKTTVCAEREKFSKSAMDLKYHMQGPYYIDGVRALDLAEDVVFVFVAQEKTPPYLVNVIQLDITYDHIGALLNRRAIDLYAQCASTNHWPSYADDVELASPPFWYSRQFEEEI